MSCYLWFRESTPTTIPYSGYRTLFATLARIWNHLLTVILCSSYSDGTLARATALCASPFGTFVPLLGPSGPLGQSNPQTTDSRSRSARSTKADLIRVANRLDPLPKAGLESTEDCSASLSTPIEFPRDCEYSGNASEFVRRMHREFDRLAEI